MLKLQNVNITMLNGKDDTTITKDFDFEEEEIAVTDIPLGHFVSAIIESDIDYTSEICEYMNNIPGKWEILKAKDKNKYCFLIRIL